ncbi:hypothetical protein R3P38DRAFT_3351300 [Favolaschia claudopus]|uniref:Uncharacterized protein n=1 Tax=Favolaschia claudopus TaxID=2862362 RepID=A0AAW0C7N2_9AGAR
MDFMIAHLLADPDINPLLQDLQTGSTSSEAAPESFLEYITEPKRQLEIVYKGIHTAKLYRRPQSTQITIWRLLACGKMKAPPPAPSQIYQRSSPNAALPSASFASKPLAPRRTLFKLNDFVARCHRDKCSLEEAATLVRHQVITSTFAQILKHPSMRHQRASPPEFFQPQVLERLLRKALQVIVQGQRSSYELLQDLYQTLVKIFASIPRIFSRAWWLRSDVRVDG